MRAPPEGAARYTESASAGHRRCHLRAVRRGLVTHPPVALVSLPEYQWVTQASAGPPCDSPRPRPGAGRSGNQGWVGSGLRSGEAPARLREPARPRQGGDQLERPGGAKMEGAAASRPVGNTPLT